MASNPFSGPVDQFGIVVPDLEAAIGEWLKRGFGPFLTLRGAAVAHYEYHGKPSQPVMDVAFAQWGDVQLEFIQPVNDAPSAYRDFISAGGNGFHHFGWFCEDYRGALAAAAGKAELQQGEWSGMHFVYYDMSDAVAVPSGLDALGAATQSAVTAAGKAGAPKIGELVELTDLSRAVFGAVREAAVGWDRKTMPVRRLLSPSVALPIAEDVLSEKLERMLHAL